ncbi:hypothetical protein HYH03_006584 [Edaphochlamys debaryana]|uniref:EF-hand domain-containing protein n=1 Tax=Edaphochlamys debaryana TaxID=47281 RepID=A0A836C0X5_9CHLO|nr:hypothetical protein HYH03_006584 [Edaphochlamys debaryana]|eukprot:KAG2495312.1 hypothetical protein HYH03_006584 [Edaphochlamys debaryana]
MSSRGRDSQQRRSTDAAGLRRTQELDRQFFKMGTGAHLTDARSRPGTADDGSGSSRLHPWSGAGTNTLPPLLPAWPEGTVTGSGGSFTAGMQADGSLLGAGRLGGSPAAQQRMHASMPRPMTVGSAVGSARRPANARSTPRRAATGSAGDTVWVTSGSGPAQLLVLGGGGGGGPGGGGGANPWEAVLDAAPALRYGGGPAARDGQGLQLLLPTGSNRESMWLYEQRLAQYMAPAATAAASNSAAAGGGGGGGSTGGRGSGSGSPGRLQHSPTRQGAADKVYAAAMAAAAAAAAAATSGPPSPLHDAALASSRGVHIPSAAWGPSADGLPPGSPPAASSLPPLVPRSAYTAAVSTPAPGAEQPWGGAGLPAGLHTATAEMRGGAVAGAAVTFRDGGGVVFMGDEEPPGSPPLTLGRLISARPSGRRQLQLMADWLDLTVGSLYEQHMGPGTPGALAAAAAALSTTAPSTSRPATASDGLDSISSRAAAAGGGLEGQSPPATAASAVSAGLAAPPPTAQPWRGAAAGGGGKAALAARFGTVASGLKDLSASLYGVATQPQLWAALVEATSAAANSLVGQVAQRCWEEGALLARLWNLQTALLDSGLAAAKRRADALASQCSEQQAKIRRLDPLIDWELDARTARESLSTELQASRALALLAGSERDALLRENDKIIAHYRRELKLYKREQRRNAYRLARKLRNTQQQLELMTRDRDLLYAAVAYTKNQTGALVDLIGGMHGHLRAVFTSEREAREAHHSHHGGHHGHKSKRERRTTSGTDGTTETGEAAAAAGSSDSEGEGEGGFSSVLSEEVLPELQQIEAGLKNIQFSVAKVRDVNQDAEDSHFVVEEQVTAVAAADTVGDELVDEVLAEGDPEPSPEEAAAAAALAAAEEAAAAARAAASTDDGTDPNSALNALAEAALLGSESSEESEYEEEGPEGGEGEGGEGATGEGEGATDGEGMAAAGSSRTLVADGSALPPAEDDHPLLSTDSANLPGEPTAAGEATAAATAAGGAAKPEGGEVPQPKKKKNRPRRGTGEEGGEEGGGRHHRRRDYPTASASAQTGQDLLKGFGDPEMLVAGSQLVVLRDALCEIGIMGNPNDDGDGTDGLLTALRQYMASLSAEGGELQERLAKAQSAAEAAEAARSELAQAVEVRGREVAAVRRELLEAKKAYTTLCDALEGLGIDPRNPTLPAAALEAMGGARLSPLTTPRETSARGLGKGEKGGKSGKGKAPVSKVAAAKEKARERAAAAAAAPSAARRAAPAGGGGAAGGRFQLPASMVAAAQRAAEEAETGGGGGGGGGGSVASTISAWRPGGGGGGGGGGGPTPVYMRPDRAAANARLQEALTRYSDAKPRTLEWLVKLIDAMYRGKTTSDDQRAKMGQEPLSLIEYMFQHLSGVYGTKELVNQYAAQLVATCLAYGTADPRVGTFQRFLMEEWDTRVLTVYLEAMRKLLEPARVPCCDFPQDYVPPGGRKGDPWPVDVRKALWVAERVLLRRAPKVAYVFAQQLNGRAEPIPPAEMDSYFVSPGSYGAELQQARAFEVARAEFKRLSSAVFLDALCGEFARMEGAYRELLPDIFRQYDNDTDGWITRSDVDTLVATMGAALLEGGVHPPGLGSTETAAPAPGVTALTESEQATAAAAIWAALTAAEGDARITKFADAAEAGQPAPTLPDGAAPGRAGATVSHVSETGFVEGAIRCDFIRAWARVFRTGAAQVVAAPTVALGESELHAAREASRRLLAVVVHRHWAHHGAAMEGFFGDAGAQAEQQLRQQAALLEGDMGGPDGDGRDGPRRASALAAVLRLLLVRKAERLAGMLTPDHLTLGPHNGPEAEMEELLARLTAAVRLLYGPAGGIWVVGAEVDELAALSGLEAADVEALPAGYKRWMASVAVRCCALHDRLHLALPPLPALPQLSHHKGVGHWARHWRRATAAAAAARRRAAGARSPSTALRSGNSSTALLRKNESSINRRAQSPTQPAAAPPGAAGPPAAASPSAAAAPPAPVAAAAAARPPSPTRRASAGPARPASARQGLPANRASSPQGGNSPVPSSPGGPPVPGAAGAGGLLRPPSPTRPPSALPSARQGSAKARPASAVSPAPNAP